MGFHSCYFSRVVLVSMETAGARSELILFIIFNIGRAMLVGMLVCLAEDSGENDRNWASLVVRISLVASGWADHCQAGHAGQSHYTGGQHKMGQTN